MSKKKNGAGRMKMDPAVEKELVEDVLAGAPALVLPPVPTPIPNCTVITAPDGSQIKIHTRRFILWRTEDVSGVSGTGVVAEGTETLCGMCTLNFISPHGHIGNYINMRALVSVHGHGGKTQVIYVDG